MVQDLDRSSRNLGNVAVIKETLVKYDCIGLDKSENVYDFENEIDDLRTLIGEGGRSSC